MARSVSVIQVSNTETSITFKFKVSNDTGYSAGSYYVKYDFDGNKGTSSVVNLPTNGEVETQSITKYYLSAGTSYNINYNLRLNEGLGNNDPIIPGTEVSGTLKTADPPPKYTYYARVQLYKNKGSWDAGGGDPKHFNENETTTASSADISISYDPDIRGGLTRDGYNLLGFSKSPTATTASYGISGSVTVNTNSTKSWEPRCFDLYAVWKEILFRQTTISLSASYDSITVTSGVEIKGYSYQGKYKLVYQLDYSSVWIEAPGVETINFSSGKTFNGSYSFSLGGYPFNSTHSIRVALKVVKNGVILESETSTNWASISTLDDPRSISISAANSDYFSFNLQFNVKNVKEAKRVGTYTIKYQVQGQSEVAQTCLIDNDDYTTGLFPVTNLKSGTKYQIVASLWVGESKIVDATPISYSTLPDPRSISISAVNLDYFAFGIQFNIKNVKDVASGEYKIKYQVEGKNEVTETCSIDTNNYTTGIFSIPNLEIGTQYQVTASLWVEDTKIKDAEAIFPSTLPEPRTIKMVHNNTKNTDTTVCFNVDIYVATITGTYSIVYSFLDRIEPQWGLEYIWEDSGITKTFVEGESKASIPITISELEQNTKYNPVVGLKVGNKVVAIDDSLFETTTAKAARYIELSNNSHENGCHSLYLNAKIAVDSMHKGFYWIQYSVPRTDGWIGDWWYDVAEITEITEAGGLGTKYTDRNSFKMLADETKNVQFIIRDFNLIEPGKLYTPKIQLIVPSQNDAVAASDNKQKISTTAASTPTPFKDFNMRKGAVAGKPVLQGDGKYHSVYLTTTEWSQYLNKVQAFVNYHNKFNGTNISFDLKDYQTGVIATYPIKKDIFIELCNNVLSKMPNYFNANLPDFYNAKNLRADLFIGLQDYLNKTIYKTY